MTLSKRTQYALRALICLADAYEQGYLQTRELAAREQLPTKFLESILSALTHGRFLISRIGATGGYRLARPPGEILIGDVVARMERMKLEEELPRAPRGTERPGEMAVRLTQTKISKSLRDMLNTTTLAGLAEQVSHHSGGQMYYI